MRKSGTFLTEPFPTEEREQVLRQTKGDGEKAAALRRQVGTVGAAGAAGRTGRRAMGFNVPGVGRPAPPSA